MTTAGNSIRDSTLRVLALCEYATLNGGERSLLAAAPALQAAGIELTVAAPAGPLASQLQRQGIAWRAFQLPSRAEAGVEQVRAAVERCVGEAGPDVVHANSLNMARLAGPVLSDARRPGLGHLRDILKLSRRAVADLNRNDRLLAVSEATRERHIAQGVNPERIAVLYNGVDLQAFRPRAGSGRLRRAFGVPESAPLAVAIGQIGLRKGWEVLLEAARQIDGVYWLLAGARHSNKAESIEYERRLRSAAAQPPLRGRFHFAGLCDAAELLAEADLLVHSARQEPLGRVLLEAAAAGRPVVATDVGGTREIFAAEDGVVRGALLAPPDDPAALATQCRRLLKDAALRRQLGADGRQIAVERFDAQRRGAELAAHYREVAAERGEP